MSPLAIVGLIVLAYTVGLIYGHRATVRRYRALIRELERRCKP